MTKQVALTDFLTQQQIDNSIALFKLYKDKSVPYIKQQIIEPYIAQIDTKIGQPNDSTFLAYMVFYTLSQISDL